MIGIILFQLFVIYLCMCGLAGRVEKLEKKTKGKK